MESDLFCDILLRMTIRSNFVDIYPAASKSSPHSWRASPANVVPL